MLSLELKKKIRLDDKIQILDNNIEELSNNERYIFESIENGKITNFNENEFITKIEEDAVKNGLLKESKIESKKIKKILTPCVIAIFIMIFTCVNLFHAIMNNPNDVGFSEVLLFAFLVILIINAPIFVVTVLGTYIIKLKNNNYIRTKKGETINENLEGLKNYLRDFSSMNEKDEKSLILWEDYLIYSVMFNQNTKITRNMCDKY